MKNYTIKSSAVLLGFALMLSACSSSSTSQVEDTKSVELELESAKQALFFYGSTTNDHYVFNTETQTLTNLNSGVAGLENFMMQDTDNGRLFAWVDNQGDTNASNDEDKVIMFESSYSFASDGNATSANFHYLAHYHDEDLDAHTNEEFNVTSADKVTTLQRLNQYMSEQETLKATLASQAEILNAGTTICDFYTVRHEEHNETNYFVLGTDGTLYTYEDDGVITFKDSAPISSAGCEIGKSGMSAAEEGVIIYLQSKLFLVDSHEEGATHVHSEWDISEVLGDGKGVDMMVGIRDLEHDGEEHDHDDEDHDGE